MDSSNTFSALGLVSAGSVKHSLSCAWELATGRRQVLTIMATFMLIPISLAIEGPTVAGLGMCRCRSGSYLKKH